jgi:anti-sigma B factor antagonist
VKYVDSSGLSAILVGNRIFSEDGGIFVLAALNDHVKKLIKISQLNNVLNILPTIEEAIDAVFLMEIKSGLEEEDDTE